MVQLIGNVVRDAVVKEIKGMRVTNFTIALNHEFTKSNGELVKQTSFIDCQYWKKSNMHKSITKGREVVVLGRIFPDAYSNKDGELKGVIRCKVDKLFLGEEPSSQPDNNTQEDESEPAGIAEPVDDLPF